MSEQIGAASECTRIVELLLDAAKERARAARDRLVNVDASQPGAEHHLWIAVANLSSAALLVEVAARKLGWERQCGNGDDVPTPH